MNKVVKDCGVTEHGQLAVLQTPCYPNQYYGGYIDVATTALSAEHVPRTNATSYFFKTIKEASDNCDRLRGRIL